MSAAVAWFARNRVAANLLLLLIVASGLTLLPTIEQEVFPEVSTDVVTVFTEYPGASPEEVERAVAIPIEEAIHALPKVRRITSSSEEGVSRVRVELESGVAIRSTLERIRTQIDSIDTFPEDVEDPVVEELVLRHYVLSLTVTGSVEYPGLRKLAEDLRSELLALPGITQVELLNVPPYEISIEVSERDLREYSITFSDIVDAVRGSSLDVPAGSLKTKVGHVLLRTENEAHSEAEFADLPLVATAEGARVEIGDVAQVTDGFADTEQSARYEGRPQIQVRVYQSGNRNVTEVATAVRELVDARRSRLPDGARLFVAHDDTELLRSRLELMLKNGIQGIVLLFLSLLLFLGFRLAWWVSVGIPVAFFGALAAMAFLDISLHVMSLFAFILALGLVVDDAIVIGENVERHQQRLGSGTESVISGTREIATPVLVAATTTVIAFLPMLLVPGPLGRIISSMPVIVTACLFFSLVEGFFILPGHLASRHAAERARYRLGGAFRRLPAGTDALLQRAIAQVYRPVLGGVLRARLLCAVVAVVFLLVVAALVVGGWVPFTFMPQVAGNTVAARVTMPKGTPSTATKRAVRSLEAAAFDLRRELGRVEAEGRDGFHVRSVSSFIGDQPFLRTQNRLTPVHSSQYSGSHLGEVVLGLTAPDLREVSSTDAARRWRELTGPVPGAAELSFTGWSIPLGASISVELFGKDEQALRRSAEELGEALRAYPGVHDVTDTARKGREEIRLRMRPEAESVGISTADLGRQLRYAFFGAEAQRTQRDRHEVPVMVRYPRKERRSLSTLESMRIRSENGPPVPLASVASLEFGRAPAAIRRIDRRRFVEVTADVDAEVTNARDVVEHLEHSVLPDLVGERAGVDYRFGGQQREQADTFDALARGLVLVMVGIYCLLAVPLRSYLQPLVILAAIPFAAAGAVLGHLLIGLDLSSPSLMGMMALAGIVVNDSLVLVNAVNLFRERGWAIEECVIEAGVTRFRPVLITSLSTFAGLAPLLLETSEQAQHLVPTATAIAFGLVLSTPVSLLLTPLGIAVVRGLEGEGECPPPEKNRPVRAEARSGAASGASK